MNNKLIIRFICILLAGQCFLSLHAQKVVISEFMSDNETTIEDADGDYSDWLELYNNGPCDIALENFCLSDDPEDLCKWKFPAVKIPAHDFLLVFASGKDSQTPSELHTNFKISSSGEALYFSNPLGVIEDQTKSIELAPDQSYGRLPDGEGNWTKLYKPTPGASNNSNNQLILSRKGGFYEKPFVLNLHSVMGDTVYYTLDGSYPSKNKTIFKPLNLNYQYTTPNKLTEKSTTPPQQYITYMAWKSPAEWVEKAHVVRFASYRHGVRTSKVHTQTYFVDSAIHTRYNMPVISLVTESGNFFRHDSGIYVPGQFFKLTKPQWSGNYFKKGTAWEKNIHLEYYSSAGEQELNQDAGVKIHGRKTRHAAQKSLRFFARKEYTENYFNHPLFPGRPYEKYQRFILRTSMGAWNGKNIINDVLAHEIVKEMNLEYQAYQPVVVFLNGEYWGIQTMRERIDEHYIAYLYGLDKDSIDIIHGNAQIIAGHNTHYLQLLDFIESNNLAFNSNYNWVKTQMDIDGYIDYMIAELFLKNYDWPANNVKLWRAQNADGKWRWIFFDMDAGYGDPNFNMLNHATASDTTIFWPNSAESTFLFRNLLKNESFVVSFLSRYAELLNQDFNIQQTMEKLNLIRQLYKDEIPMHCIRWSYPDDYNEWATDIADNIQNFLINRPCAVESNILNFFDLDEFAFKCLPDKSSDPIENALIVAPNPGNGFFFIHNNSPDEVAGNLRVTDLKGQLIYMEDDLVLVAHSRKYFDLSTASSGTYVLTLLTDLKAIQEKIIILH